MRMTFRLVVIGGLIVFLAVVAVAVFVPSLIWKPDRTIIAEPYTDIEAEGRKLFYSNGCNYCHTQYVRAQDNAMGPVSEGGNYIFDNPMILGSERTGPDAGGPRWIPAGFRRAPCSATWRWIGSTGCSSRSDGTPVPAAVRSRTLTGRCRGPVGSDASPGHNQTGHTNQTESVHRRRTIPGPPASPIWRAAPPRHGRSTATCRCPPCKDNPPIARGSAPRSAFAERN